MRTLIAVMLMVAGTTVIAQQTNTLNTLRQVYEKKEQSTLTQYGKDLDTITANLKKKGDLDNVLILQSERKRFDAEKTVLAPKDAKDSFRPAIELQVKSPKTEPMGDIQTSAYITQGGKKKFGQPLEGEMSIFGDEYRIHVFRKSVIFWRKIDRTVQSVFFDKDFDIR